METKLDLLLQGMLQNRNSDHVAVRDVINNESLNLDEFGIEEEGPVPALEAAFVVVPESPINLSDESVNALHQAISHVPLADDGIGHFGKYHNTLCLSPPNFCISIVFVFSWGLCNSQEKLETMLMQNLGGQRKSIMVFFEVAYCILLGDSCNLR